ncbi:MAG: hypothetical protein PSV36_08315 [Algoriphagus sp.]|nr:hypothetical protein [Algoriphagus sp.]
MTIIYGVIGLLGGLIALTIESKKSLKDLRNEGWSYTRSKFVVGSWGLVIVGVILIIVGIFEID